MSMKREDRFRRIRINGERIADVDYEQLYPFLAYVRARADMPEGDFYDVLGDQSSRKGWKILTNALLFAEEGSFCSGPSNRIPSHDQQFGAVRKVGPIIGEGEVTRTECGI
ncbi:hypothetical protein Q3C01_32625 [Bradyrhizobium sp. UFLA05-109]